MSPQLKADLTHHHIPSSDDGSLMTVAEVCAFAKCGRTFLYGEIAKRRIQSFKLGSATRFKRQHVEEWLSNRLIPAGQEVA
jgi:excisionase family DNA binding protein